MEKKTRLGDLLLNEGILTETQLQDALNQQKETGAKLGQVLVAMGLIKEDKLLEVMSKQLGVPVLDLSHYQLNFELSRILPEAYSRRFRAIVLEEQPQGLLVGMSDPFDITAVDELRRVLNQPMQLVLIREAELLRSIDLIYRRTDEISQLAGQLDQELSQNALTLEEIAIDKDQLGAPVVKLLQSLFQDAAQVKASDIHIEPDEKVLRIRLRIDGILHEQTVREQHIAQALALRLKLMAGLNITEKRVPQDGRFNIKVRDKVIDIRLSTLPTQYGESIVMRLLDQSDGILSLDDVGMEPAVLKKFRHLLSQPHGLILVTGPTGSGKTTTLYGALNELNDVEKKIITVEDPVEYRLPRVNQVQIQSKLGLDFARVLRTALRQDPDIMLVGEMRDRETASIAIRSALTGHLVLSTLHTNDAASSAMRMVDMGVEGYLVAATLRGILAQRLVRRICDGCKKKYKLSDKEKGWLDRMIGEGASTGDFHYGEGCNLCNRTGYKGRIGIFELLELNQEMMDALRQGDPTEFSKISRKAMKGKLLLDKGIKLAQEGVTTISEAIRIAGDRD